MNENSLVMDIRVRQVCDLEMKKRYPLKDSLCTRVLMATSLPFSSPDSSFFEDRESLSRNLKI